MAQSYEVIQMLRPLGGYTQIGSDYDGITFLEAEPFTKKEYDEAFAKFDSWKSNEDAKAEAAKASAQAKLEALGLTADDLKALGL